MPIGLILFIAGLVILLATSLSTTLAWILIGIGIGIMVLHLLIFLFFAKIFFDRW